MPAPHIEDREREAEEDGRRGDYTLPISPSARAVAYNLRRQALERMELLTTAEATVFALDVQPAQGPKTPTKIENNTAKPLKSLFPGSHDCLPGQSDLF